MAAPRRIRPNNPNSRPPLSRAALIACLTLLAISAFACSVPVYRYALERWPADPYGVLVYHKGKLTAEQQRLVDRLSSVTRDESEVVNLESHIADLDSDPEPQLAELWEKQKYATAPWMMLYYPNQSGIRDVVWSGPLNKENVDRLIDSPARREIARRLLSEDSAVWVLVETGDKERDEAAAKLLDERVEALEKELKLPKILAQDVAEGLLNIPETELKIAFSSIRVSRDDAAESIFLQQLLGMESDLRELREPIVFPIFGRGRALYALAGAGINAENIREAGSFLIGPCSCQVKDQNPGVDILMAVNWDKLVQFEVDLEKELPPLSGFLAMTDAEATASESAEPTAQDQTTAPTPAEIDDLSQAGTAAAQSAESVESTSNLGLLLVGAMGAVVLLVGFFLFGRNS